MVSAFTFNMANNMHIKTLFIHDYTHNKTANLHVVICESLIHTYFILFGRRNRETIKIKFFI